MIYADNASTTFPKSEEVYAAADEFMRKGAVVPGSGEYAAARAAGELLADTRERLLQLVHAGEDVQVFFTPSATIAMNQIIHGLPLHYDGKVYISSYENSAAYMSLYQLQQKLAFISAELPMTEKLEIDLDRTRELFEKNAPAYVLINHVSNVTGYILPVEKLCALAKEYHAMTIVDGSQALGIVPVDLKRLQADVYIFSGHKKLGGPLGVGGFFLRDGVEIQPTLFGASGAFCQDLEMPTEGPGQYEPACVDLSAVAGLGAALRQLSPERMQKNLLHEQQLAEELVKKLSAINGVTVVGREVSEAVGIVSFAVASTRSDKVAEYLDRKYGIAVRSGFHSAPCIHKQLGYHEDNGLVRASVGPFNCSEDMDALAEAVAAFVAEA